MQAVSIWSKLVLLAAFGPLVAALSDTCPSPRPQKGGNAVAAALLQRSRGQAKATQRQAKDGCSEYVLQGLLWNDSLSMSSRQNPATLMASKTLMMSWLKNKFGVQTIVVPSNNSDQLDLIAPAITEEEDVLTKVRDSFFIQSQPNQVREFQDAHVAWIGRSEYEGDINFYNWVIAQPSSCQVWYLDDAKEGNLSEGLGSEFTEVDRAITIAQNMVFEYWHAPTDFISSLASMNSSLLADENVYLHLGFSSDDAKHNYMMDWLDIVNISASRVLTGHIRARHLYAPETAVAYPSKDQLQWLQFRIWNSIGYPDIHSRNLLIVMKRATRGISNHNSTVVPLAEEYASAHGLTVYYHDDGNLPSVNEQLSAFARAKMILAPHGAGMAMIAATAPGACVIEVFTDYHHPFLNARAVHLEGHYYSGIVLDPCDSTEEVQDPNCAIEPAVLRQSMEKCGQNAGL